MEYSFRAEDRGNKPLRLQTSLICTYLLAGKRVPIEHPNSPAISLMIAAVIDYLKSKRWPIEVDAPFGVMPAYLLGVSNLKLKIPTIASDLVAGRGPTSTAQTVWPIASDVPRSEFETYERLVTIAKTPYDGPTGLLRDIMKCGWGSIDLRSLGL